MSAKAKSVCGGCHKPAKMNCTNCSKFLCGDCCMEHKEISPIKDHEITSIANMKYSGNPSIHKSNSTDTKAAGDVQRKSRKRDSECDDAREDDSNKPQNNEQQKTAKDKQQEKAHQKQVLDDGDIVVLSTSSNLKAIRTCKSCDENSDNIKAIHWCKECKKEILCKSCSAYKYVCDNCSRMHEIHKATKNPVLKSGNEARESDAAREDDSNKPQRNQETQNIAKDKQQEKANQKQLETEDLAVVNITEGKYYYPTKELGRGSFAVVYEGRSGCNGAMQSVAVKQILRKDKDPEKMREISETKILQGLEQKRNRNVVGYYELFLNEKYLYIFTELFHGTLEHYVKDDYKKLRTSFSATVVNRRLAEGLRFLHAEGVVHRDLKPSNIFIGLNGKGTKIEKVVIGDFGSAKMCRMQFEHSSSMSITNAPGTAGYVAPEVWKWYRNVDEKKMEKEKKYFTVKSDTYSLGLIFYFTISNGMHPFGRGDGYTIQDRIKNAEEPNLEEASIEYRCLIRQMIKTDITERMFAEDVLNHPAIWKSKKILEYFKEKSNFLKESKDPMVDMLKAKLEASETVRSRGWMVELPAELKESLCNGLNKGRYKEHSVTALLRAIRNTEHHIDSYPELSGGPDQRLTIWMGACPELTIGVYGAFIEYDQRALTHSQKLNQAPIDKDIEQTEVLNAANQTPDGTDMEQTKVLKAINQTPADTDTEQTAELKVVNQSHDDKDTEQIAVLKLVNISHDDKDTEQTAELKVVKRSQDDNNIEQTAALKVVNRSQDSKDTEQTEVLKGVNRSQDDTNTEQTEVLKVVNRSQDDKDGEQTAVLKAVNRSADDKDGEQTAVLKSVNRSQDDKDTEQIAVLKVVNRSEDAKYGEQTEVLKELPNTCTK